MPGARDLLDRLRPVGTPGAASPAAVPADPHEQASQELAPVFARLRTIDAECAATRQTADDGAARTEADSISAAADLVARARAAAPRVRADAAADRKAAAARTLVATRAAAEAEAARVAQSAERRLPAFVDLVVSRARARLASLGASGGAR